MAARKLAFPIMHEDSLQRFLFEKVGIRGEVVHLDRSWRAVMERHTYPQPVLDQLGQAMAAVVLLSATIKFTGALILQVQGDGPLSTVVTQATDHRTIRGIARWRDEVPAGPLATVFGSGRLVLTIESEAAEPYQGVVPLTGERLAEAIEDYFSRSEQLPTRLWLAANRSAAAGLFLQQVPAHRQMVEDWNRIAMLADTVTSSELLQSAGTRLLYRLFHEEQVRLFEPERVSFRCSCTRDRIERVLAALGRQEIDEIIRSQQTIDVRCEFCNRLYQFDAVDASALFTDASRAPSSRLRH